jgi:hypothetical protein
LATLNLTTLDLQLLFSAIEYSAGRNYKNGNQTKNIKVLIPGYNGLNQAGKEKCRCSEQ